MKCEVIERNAERYLETKSIDLSYRLGDVKMDFKFHGAVPEIIQTIVNEQSSSNWKQLKPIIEAQLEEYVSEVVHKTVAPIFQKIAIKDFFCDQADRVDTQRIIRYQ